MTTNDDELVTVATFSNTAEAELAKEHLELEGVTAFVVGSVTASVVPHLTDEGGVAVQVAAEDVETAREILGASDA